MKSDLARYDMNADFAFQLHKILVVRLLLLQAAYFLLPRHIRQSKPTISDKDPFAFVDKEIDR